jgi:hypothetical protein
MPTDIGPYQNDLVNFLLKRAKRSLRNGDMPAYHKDFDRAWQMVLRTNPRAREAFQAAFNNAVPNGE